MTFPRPITPAITTTAGSSIGNPTVWGSSFQGSNPLTTFTFATTASIIAGNLALLCITREGNNPSSITSVSDSVNTYTLAASAPGGLNSHDHIYYASNASGVASGATVTISSSNAANTQNMMAAG